MVVSAIEMYAVVRSYILFAQLRFFTVIFPLTIIVEYTFTMAHLSNTSDPSHCNRYITVVTFPIWFFSLFSFLSYRIFSPVCVCLNFVCVFFRAAIKGSYHFTCFNLCSPIKRGYCKSQINIYVYWIRLVTHVIVIIHQYITPTEQSSWWILYMASIILVARCIRISK